jgi:hypothetical protein
MALQTFCPFGNPPERGNGVKIGVYRCTLTADWTEFAVPPFLDS